MKLSIKKYFVLLVTILLIIHLGYFIYGFNHFRSIYDADIYFTFYRFKFYDDVSISHFFITCIFLFFSTLFFLKNYRKIIYTSKQILLILFSIYITVLISCTFFISFSLGQRTKIYTLLPEKKFNEDKKTLNILNTFLYNSPSQKAINSFDIENVLYPKPYPIIKSMDSIENYDGSFYVDENYYSIDTLVMLTKTYNALDKIVDSSYSIFDDLGIPKIEFKKSIIAKKEFKDSIQIIYKGKEVYPDDDINIFMMNSYLFNAIHNKSINEQKYEAAKDRYNLLFTYKVDSLKNKLDQLQDILNTYKIDAKINSEKFAKEILKAKIDNYNINYVSLDNNIERPVLEARFKTLNNLLYDPQYLHESIRNLFFVITGILALFIGLLFLLLNKLKTQKSL